MKGVGGNKQKFTYTTICNRFWQNNTEKLSKRLFSPLKIVQILDCKFLVDNVRCAGPYLRVFTVPSVPKECTTLYRCCLTLKPDIQTNFCLVW